ncbi:MAG: hypothetical protein KGQ51_01110 [Planctomycetes bacterium]|nr:hypothetical protein [Planctomycetota bacterium]
MLSSLFQKPLGAITVLGTAIGGPYALFETELGTAARSAIQGMLTSAPAGQTEIPASGGSVPGGVPPLPHGMLIPQNPQFVSASSPQSSAPPVSGNNSGTISSGAVPPWTPPPVYDLREVIRFDMHPMALPQRFGQVTTLTGYPQFEAYRVPLTTGTGPTDLVGTLTYCFDANKAVQRIQFLGTTGDPSMISGMMVHFYGLRPEASLGGQLFTTRWNNRITSLLQVRPADVMTAQSPSGNYHIFLELNQASTYFGLSEEAYRMTGIAPPTSGNSFFGF